MYIYIYIYIYIYSIYILDIYVYLIEGAKQSFLALLDVSIASMS